MTALHRGAGTSFNLAFSSFLVPKSRSIWLFLPILLSSLLGLGMVASCRSMNSNEENLPQRDINAVLAEHDDQLLALPGVVGVYVGLMSDEKTPCLKVMLARDNSAVKRSIPPVIEGYPVITEVTGEIKPMTPQ